MKMKKKLYGKQLFIDHDLTHEERDVQAKIRTRAKEEKANGNQVKVGYKKMVVNGTKWVWGKDKSELRKEEDSTIKN